MKLSRNKKIFRGSFLCTRKFRWNSLVHKKARPANDAHSRDEEVCRKRPRSARECAKAHSYLRRKRDLNPCAGATDLLVFEARPFNHLGIPPVIANYTSIQYFSGFV